jgi:two-component system, NarL family, nitrate/nitrite response regulator NarL
VFFALGGRYVRLKPIYQADFIQIVEMAFSDYTFLRRAVKLIQNIAPMYRVLIVDRDSMSGDLLAMALTRVCDCDAIVVDSANLLPALSTKKVDIVVIGSDLNSIPGAGFDLAHKVSLVHPNIAVVMLLNHTTQESVITAFRSGARAVFSRQQPMTDFVDCIEHVKRGFIWAGRQETNSLLEAFKNIPAPNLVTNGDSPTLTARELQVVQYAAKGKTNRAIANDLGLSEHTVKNYLFRAFEKLGVSNRVELLFYLTIRGHSFGPASSEEPEMELGIEA